MNEEKTSQILVLARPDYSLAAIATTLKTHPDSIWSITDEKSIKIDVIRRLQQELSTASATQSIRHVVVFPAERITEQAQQALLKLIEEPPKNTQITLVTSAISQVLPTIQSRCVVRIIQTPKTDKKRTNNSLYEQLCACTSWAAVVELAQKQPTKKEEVRHLLQQEYAQTFAPTEPAITFQEILAEVLESLDHNVQPTLCLEKLLLTTYEKAAN